jgi:prevent-host-death family protein
MVRPVAEDNNRAKPSDDRWTIGSARLKFLEVARRARDVGPQFVTVRGQDTAVVLSGQEYQRLKDEYSKRNPTSPRFRT